MADVSLSMEEKILTAIYHIKSKKQAPKAERIYNQVKLELMTAGSFGVDIEIYKDALRKLESCGEIINIGKDGKESFKVVDSADVLLDKVVDFAEFLPDKNSDGRDINDLAPDPFLPETPICLNVSESIILDEQLNVENSNSDNLKSAVYYDQIIAVYERLVKHLQEENLFLRKESDTKNSLIKSLISSTTEPLNRDNIKISTDQNINQNNNLHHQKH